MRLNQNSRKERVIAQHDGPDAATEYVRSTRDARPDGRFRLSRRQLVQDVLAGHPGGAVGAVAGITSRRARRWRRIGLALAVAVTIMSAATARLFVWPAQGMPTRVSAIVMMDGPGRMLGRTLRLARQHRPRFLVISLGTPDSSYLCPRPIGGIRLICFNPRPASTAGEAEYIGRLARRYHWRSVALVTITPQGTRARLRVERCFAGRVYVVTTPPDPAQTSWPYQLAYQWGALVKALILQTSC